jgi:hypothetical protein
MMNYFFAIYIRPTPRVTAVPFSGRASVTDMPGPVPRERSRRDWRALARSWGPAGNERLTTSAGLVLLVLLAFEALTTLSLRSYLPAHIFVGILLLAPIALKLASTGWRFLRYYTANKAYRLEGPPRLLLRLLAPLLIASTLSLFGSGIAMIVVGHGGGPLLTLHAVSFGVWGVLIAIHILAYLARVLPVGTADWRRRTASTVAGARSRRGALFVVLVTGVIIAVATYPAQQTWMSHRRTQEHAARPARAAAATHRR